MGFAETEVSFSESVFASRAVAAEPTTVAGWGPGASVVLVQVAGLDVPVAADATVLACAGIWEVEVANGPLRRPDHACVGIIVSVADRPFVGLAPVEGETGFTSSAPSSTEIGIGTTGRQDTADDASFAVQVAKVTTRPNRPVP